MYRRLTGLAVTTSLFFIFVTGCVPVIPAEIRQEVSSAQAEDGQAEAQPEAVTQILAACTSGLPFEHYAVWRTADWNCADSSTRRCAARTFFEAFDPDGYAAVIAYGDPDYLNEALDAYTDAMDRFFRETKGAFCLQDFYDLNKEAPPQEDVPVQEGAEA